MPPHPKGEVALVLDCADLDRAAELWSTVLGYHAGASRLTQEPMEEGGWLWHVLAEPDGNEFCVLQPPESHWDDADLVAPRPQAWS